MKRQYRLAPSASAKSANVTSTANVLVQRVPVTTKSPSQKAAPQAAMTTIAAADVREGDAMINFLLSSLFFLNSCVAIAQENLEFIDYSVARQVPDFELKDMNHGGAVYKSTDHAGSVFVIEFYFAGCPSCNSNANNFKRLATEFKENSKIQFVEISIDCSADDYADWINKHQPFVPVLNACDRSFPGDMDVHMFPTTVVVNPAKTEAMRGTGVWSSAAYERMKKYLSQVKTL